MLMIDRELLDRKLPDGPELRALAEQLTELDLSHDMMGRGLRWLAELTERNRFSGLDGQNQTIWPIEASGLEYKQKLSYLTAEGWPLGTTCWFVRIENASYHFAAGETPELALLRGLVICGLAVRALKLPTSRERYLPRLVDNLPALPELAP